MDIERVLTPQRRLPNEHVRKGKKDGDTTLVEQAIDFDPNRDQRKQRGHQKGYTSQQYTSHAQVEGKPDSDFESSLNILA